MSRRALDPRRFLGNSYAVVIALFVLVTLHVEPYDDALFFKRTALNLLDHGRLAWNLKDGAVYGATAQSFQLLVVAVTAVLRDYSVLGVRVLLACCLVIAHQLSLRSAEQRPYAVTLGFCSPPLLYSAISGMESAFTVLLMALFLCSIQAASPRRFSWVLGPALATLLYATRPDTLLLTVPLLLFFAWRRSRRPPFREALTMLAGVGLLLLVFKLCYGTALPLPAHAKLVALSPYDAEFVARAAEARPRHLGLFLVAAMPLVLLSLRRRDAVNFVLLGGAALFATYHLVGTIDIMGMHARFYAPALPLLTLSASRAADATPPRRIGEALGYAAFAALLYGAGFVPTPGNAEIWAVAPALYAAFVVSAALVVAGLGAAWLTPLLIGAGIVAGSTGARPKLRSDAAYLAIAERHVTSFRGMRPLRDCLGERIHVYHSELGVIGLYFQRGTVTDLAGLWSPEWLWRRESFDTLCGRDRPEAMFLPHANYVRLNREIGASACIGGYTRVVSASSSPLHVRNDLLPRYRRCDPATP